MTTRQIAGLLRTTSANILAGIRNGRFLPPAKDPHGFYVWTPTDVDRARDALAIDRRRKPAPEGQEAARA